MFLGISKLLAALVVAATLLVTASPGRAQEGGLALVRDAEIEDLLSRYASPLFKAANLQTGAVKIYLVQDDTLNAFVAGGQRIFVFTGLILATRHPGELVGVLAHETGHIRAGHLSRTRDAISSAQTISILAALLGGVAAAASGNGDVAGAGLLGGSGAGQQLFLNYSRTQESAADQAAVKLMERAGWSPRGVVDFMEVLDGQDLLLGQRGNPYLRSHPLGYERIEALQHLVSNSPLRDQPAPDGLERAHRMMQAKLFGFTRQPAATMRKYPASDQSDPARYARAVALMKQARTDEAIAELQPLIDQEPLNPYLHELKGQIYLEGGRVADSIPPLREASILSRHVTISTLLASALIASETREGNDEALAILQQVLRIDQDFPTAWRQLSIVHGRRGDLGLSTLASAEYYIRSGQPQFAREQVDRALRALKPGSPEHFRAQDLELAVENLERQLKRN